MGTDEVMHSYDRNKARIMYSMLELLKTQSLCDITVKDIMKKAQLSKRTFYNYFLDKFACVSFYWEKTMEPYTNSEWDVYHYSLFSELNANREITSNLATYVGQNDFASIITDEMMAEWKKHISIDVYGKLTYDEVSIMLDIMRDSAKRNHQEIISSSVWIGRMITSTICRPRNLTNLIIYAGWSEFYSDEVLADGKHI